MNFLVYNNCLPNMEHSHLKLKMQESNLHGELDKGSWTLYSCFVMYIFWVWKVTEERFAKSKKLKSVIMFGKERKIMVGIGFPFGLWYSESILIESVLPSLLEHHYISITPAMSQRRDRYCLVVLYFLLSDDTGTILSWLRNSSHSEKVD